LVPNPKFQVICNPGRIRTFYRKKPVFTKKKFPSLCGLPWFHGCPNEIFVRPNFERYFQIRDLSFWITEEIGLTGVSFHFWPQNQIPSGSHRNFWLLFHFHVKSFPILMFLGCWCKILCWSQKSILYGVWNATGSHESPKTEFVSHEIFISRVTYPSEILCWAQKSILKCNREAWEPKNVKFK
jgi:hypothetical protein